ncbi:glycosyltransferase [Ammoniphilus sp. 3BR4]|uniref:glycosyltransferase n=1 Tax=Ammoniphilus sp. 3BR4 TaxID=3158265 RepID=UPI003465D6C5
MKTSIIILTCNKLEYTKLCINSIREYTKEGSYEIIVVDNHSSDGTVEWLSAQKDIISILNNENLGFPKGCNQGIELASGENILLLNNDTIVTENWLNNLIVALYSSDKIGAVGPVTNSASYYQSIITDYQSIDEMHHFALRNNRLNYKKWDNRLKLVGFCMLIKREVVERIGLLDERFSPGNFEDDDYSFRILSAGYQLLLCKDTFIHHFGSISFRDNPTHYNSLLKGNEMKFEDKWGFNPNYSSLIRNDIINLIDPPQDLAINVLEIECACGGTLMQIKNKYKNVNLYGIEMNDQAGAIASQFAKVQKVNIESELLGYPEEFFDYIILPNVLEHLFNPWKVVKNLEKHLKSNGKLLVSIRNAMHYSMLSDLINGNISYTHSRNPDRTPLRFFTLEEIKKMFKESGYEKIDFGMTTINKTESDEQFIKLLSITNGGQLTDQYNAYQYLVTVRKKDYTEELKKVLRRLEFEIDRESNQNRLLNIILEGQVDPLEILHVVNKDIIQKEYILNMVSILCYQNKAMDYVLPFLQAAFEINNKNPDTLFNLGFVLYQLGEKNLAANFLEPIAHKDDEAQTLLLEIKGNKDER